MKIQHRLRAGVAALALLAAVPAAHAAVITFAQFSQAGAGGNVFTYLIHGADLDAQLGTSTGGPLGAAVPVNFNYLTIAGPLPADLQGTQNATLSMTSSTVSPYATGFGGTIAAEPITGAGAVTDIISFVRSTPAAEGAGTRTNLLTVTFTAQLSGTVGGRTPQLMADTGLGFTVNYTSDFLTFNNALEKDFSLTFSSWISVVGGGGLGLGGDGFFTPATAAGAGTFDGTATSTPEPATLALAACGALGLLARRPRKTAR